MQSALNNAISMHRDALIRDLSQPFRILAQHCSAYLQWPKRLDQQLVHVFSQTTIAQQEYTLIGKSRLLYIVNLGGEQLSGNVSVHGIDTSLRGQNLAHRPYMQQLRAGTGFVLSPVYIDYIHHLPCVTGIQALHDSQNRLVAYLLADFSLADLPDNAPNEKPVDPVWRQIKGDPAIRGQLFAQQRVMSPMDEQLAQVNSIINTLVVYHGVFHVKLHYSSSRATLWLYDKPHAYQVHVLNEIISPEVCLVYPRRAYPEKACISREKITLILERFAGLRFADDTIYLRSASLNIINGYVGLTFSCDGSHYMSINDFLEKDESFWFG